MFCFACGQPARPIRRADVLLHVCHAPAWLLACRANQVSAVEAEAAVTHALDKLFVAAGMGFVLCSSVAAVPALRVNISSDT